MQLPFPPTPHQCLRAAQLLACGTAALSTVMLGRPGGPHRGARLVTSAVAFFSAAFMTRYMLQETESRLQIATFALAAALAEALRSAAVESPFSVLRWGFNACVAAAGVLLAKHILEPGAIAIFTLRAVDAARQLLGV